MNLNERFARRLIRLIEAVSRPRPLDRAAKRNAGLKYCSHPGYGYRWSRGWRVPNPQEREIMTKIVELRGAGQSWYQIAALLMRQRMLTPAGREWSPSRVRRAYGAELHHRELRD